MRNANRRHEVTGAANEPQHGHAHKFRSPREHRHAHKLADREAGRRRIRASARTLARSEWLDRSPGDTIIAPGFKQPGRKYGPAAYGAGLGPREGAMPLLLTQRLANYNGQNGAGVKAVQPGCAPNLTPRQTRRAGQKQRQIRTVAE